MGRSHKITIANNERLIRRHVLLVRTAPGMTHHRWALEHLWHYQFSVSPSFLIFAMNMAVILMSTVQNFITIGQTKLMLWTNDISWVCISRWVGGGGGGYPIYFTSHEMKWGFYIPYELETASYICTIAYMWDYILDSTVASDTHNFVLLCLLSFTCEFIWYIYSYTSGLLHWHWGKRVLLHCQ